jgi:hypothetical protein
LTHPLPQVVLTSPKIKLHHCVTTAAIVEYRSFGLS